MSPTDASLMAQQLDEGRDAEILRLLSEPEALVVAQLLEQIATDQGNELSSIAQQMIVRIYDRLEASIPNEESPHPPVARGTIPRSRTIRTLATLLNPARKGAF